MKRHKDEISFWKEFIKSDFLKRQKIIETLWDRQKCGLKNILISKTLSEKDKDRAISLFLFSYFDDLCNTVDCIKEPKKRQGMSVTIEELDNLANELQSQLIKDMSKFFKEPGERLRSSNQAVKKTRFQINIINKTPECSDTWRLE